MHGYLLGRNVQGDADRRLAATLYARMVRDADDSGLWQEGLRQQLFLGDDAFVARTLQTHAPPPQRLHEVPKAQMRLPTTLQALLATHPGDRGQALRAAYRRGGCTMGQIAAHVGLSISRVSRLIAAAEGRCHQPPKATLQQAKSPPRD